MAGTISRSPAVQEWRTNWTVVVASMIGYALSVVHVYSLGVMIGPIEREFGWSRALITSGYSIVAGVVFLFSPVVGAAIDRYGPRPIALAGVMVYCSSIALLALAQNNVGLWWLLWFLVGMGTLLLKPTVWTAAISRLFNASRGLALAVALSASGIISSCGPLATYYLTETFGWRIAYLAWAAIGAVIALPTILLFFTVARAQPPPSIHLSKGAAGRPAAATIRQNILSATFLKLAIASALVALVFTALIVNLVPVMIASGITGATAAAIVGVVGISQIIGRLTSGILLDCYDAGRITAVVVCFPVITCIVLIAFAGSIPLAVMAALFFGVSVGAELDAIAYLASRHFGTVRFGTLFGTIIGLTALGGGLGPFLANTVYDLTGSYEPVLWGIIPLCLVSAYLLQSLGQYTMGDDHSKAQTRTELKA